MITASRRAKATIAFFIPLRRDNEAERGASIRMRMPEAWNAGRA
jgi:hypothetical protein